MDLLRTTRLTDSQKCDLTVLTDSCRRHDRIALSFPEEDGNLYLLLYEKETLLSALSAFFDEADGSYECCAFTAPSCRKKGYFDRLLGALEDIAGDAAIIFPVDATCRATVLTLQAIGAKLWYEEFLMERRLAESDATDNGKPVEACSPHAPLSVTLSCESHQTEYLLEFHARIPTSEPLIQTPVSDKDMVTAIGSCRLDVRGETAYFYNFQIKESIRHKGFGTLCFSEVWDFLHQLSKKEKLKTVLLQVSGDNVPALAIYRKFHFQVVETLSYYLC